MILTEVKPGCCIYEGLLRPFVQEPDYWKHLKLVTSEMCRLKWLIRLPWVSAIEVASLHFSSGSSLPWTALAYKCPNLGRAPIHKRRASQKLRHTRVTIGESWLEEAPRILVRSSTWFLRVSYGWKLTRPDSARSIKFSHEIKPP